MLSILCFGDSNTWGHIPGSFNPQTGINGRLDRSKRWTGILQKTLGENYHIIEEAINGRTTNLDEVVPGRPYKNGLSQLQSCLESHYPLDAIIFMLGTNDTKTQYGRSAAEIAEGMKSLIRTVKISNKGKDEKAPKVLLIAPQPIISGSNIFPSLDTASIQKSEQIAEHYQKLAQKENCEFLDAGLIISSSLVDGVHLGEQESIILGHAVAKILLKMFP
jgi:lysophospholipase L1-like esterase